MAYHELSKTAAELRDENRREEAENPELLNKWKTVAPDIVEHGVTAATGSSDAGKAAKTAVRAGIASNSDFADSAARGARDATQAVGLGILGGVCSVVGAIALPVLAIGVIGYKGLQAAGVIDKDPSPTRSTHDGSDNNPHRRP